MRSQGLASIAKTGKGLYAKSLAVQMQDALATLTQKNKNRISVLKREKKDAEDLGSMFEDENKELNTRNKHLEEENGTDTQKTAFITTMRSSFLPPPRQATKGAEKNWSGR